MILAVITSYATISSILVPITGLLLPGFTMAFLFLKMKAKNQIVIPETGQVWIHIAYPYIQKMKVTDGMTIQDLVRELNATSKNPNLSQLEQEIHDLKKLKDKGEIAFDELNEVQELTLDVNIVFYPIIYKKDLRK